MKESDNNKSEKKTIIAISSQFNELLYNKEASGKKHREMGGSELIQKKFYQQEED